MAAIHAKRVTIMWVNLHAWAVGSPCFDTAAGQQPAVHELHSARELVRMCK